MREDGTKPANVPRKSDQMERAEKIEASFERLIKLLRQNKSPLSIDFGSKNEFIRYNEEYQKLVSRLAAVSPDLLNKRIPSMEQYTPISNSQYSMF